GLRLSTTTSWPSAAKARPSSVPICPLPPGITIFMSQASEPRCSWRTRDGNRKRTRRLTVGSKAVSGGDGGPDRSRLVLVRRAKALPVAPSCSRPQQLDDKDRCCHWRRDQGPNCPADDHLLGPGQRELRQPTAFRQLDVGPPVLFVGLQPVPSSGRDS